MNKALSKAYGFKAEYMLLNRKASDTWSELVKVCPHDWEEKEHHEDPDCDGLFGAHYHYRECKVCKKTEKLERDSRR